MSRRIRQCSLIIAAQTLCVGVGLWMNHSFAASSIRLDVERQETQHLAVAAKRLASSLATHPTSEHPATASQGHRQPVLVPTGQLDCGAVILDARGRIAERIVSLPSMTASLDWKPDTVFPAWHPLRNGVEPSKDDSPGTFTLDEQTFIAARASLEDDSGRQVVVFAARGDIERAATALTSPLLQISALTLLWCCALLGIGIYLIMARFHDDVDGERDRVQADRFRQSQDIVRTRDAVIFGLAKLADSRDTHTGDHLERIVSYSTALASALRRHPRFTDRISPAFVRLIAISSALHDIGKVGIADHILLKPGPLTDDEREAMQLHAVIGGKCLEKIENRLGSSNFLQMAREVAFAHHERWDGTGYPLRLKGEEIPLAARIVAIADVYDALSSKRVYKDALPHDECAEIIREETGKHFDPEIIKVWLTIEPQFRRIAQQYAEEENAESSSTTPVSPEAGAEDDESKTLVLPGVGGAC